MTNHLLFIDTEASALPIKWNLPLTADANWPHIVQVAWIIYDKNRAIVKTENHYIKNNGFNINPSAIKIHGITPEYLAANGEERDEVLQLLRQDILQYQPLVIGHFMRLDYYVLGADFYRSKIENPLTTLPIFCTMVATKQLIWNPMPRQLRLGDLYHYLFNKELTGQHNALIDAQATADSFYELLNRGEINDDYISSQSADFEPFRDPTVKPKGCMLPVFLLACLLMIIIIWLS